MTGGTSRWAAAVFAQSTLFATLLASTTTVAAPLLRCQVADAGTTHTIEDNQRSGWVLRLTLDKQGVRGFDTRVARISFDGIPTLDLAATSPCWKRGDGGVGLCRGD
jgi:hypothetical protein